MSFQVTARALGGPGSGHYGHAGRPGQVGGSATRGGTAITPVELARQEALANAQTNPLARPEFVLGMDNAVSGELQRYVAAYGEEFKAAPLPKGVEQGPKKECYKNASLLLMSHPELTYAEGFATSVKTGSFVFMHAWLVDAAGNVVDPTWDTPETNTYFGVKYDRDKYLKYLYKAKIYGVLSSTFKNAQKAVATGGQDLR